jgi:ribosomal protein L37AE/L43A
MEVDMYVVDKAMLKVIQVPDDYKECPVCHLMKLKRMSRTIQ